MDTATALCFIRQMFKELRNMDDEATALAQALTGNYNAKVYSNKATAIDRHKQSLIECRQYFNRAFRGLLKELATAE